MTDDTTPFLPTVRHSGSRRRSKLTSGGRWDWSYEPEDSQNDDHSSFGIKFHVIKTSGKLFKRKKDLILYVSVQERSIRLSSETKNLSFPTASVSRLTPKGALFLEVRAARPVGKRRRFANFGKKNHSWMKVLEFDSSTDRDEFLKLVRGLNAVGGIVSSVFSRVESFITPDKLVKGLISIETTEGNTDYDPPKPKIPLDETEFFRWFLMISNDSDPNVLLRRLEELLIEDEVKNNNNQQQPPQQRLEKSNSLSKQQTSFNSSSLAQQDLLANRPKASSLSKRGPLFHEPKLFPNESLITIEDTVTFVHQLDSKEIRHVVGELILTNYRLSFSIYESELTARPNMSGMNGVEGLAQYVNDFDRQGSLSGMISNSISPPKSPENSEGSEDYSAAAVVNLKKSSSYLDLVGGDLRASVPSSRFGRRPDTVFVSVTIPLSFIAKVEAKHSSLIAVTTLGRYLNFQFDRVDNFLSTFVERVGEARQKPFYSSLLLHESVIPCYQIYDVKQEFLRQNVNNNSSSRFSFYENTGYDLCSTYPSFLVVPREFVRNPSKIVSVARFRSKARVPSITWVHPTNGAVLARSSQPLTGLKQAKCIEDEELLLLLGGGKKMFVIDARGPAAVAGNQLVRGKGAELPSRYPEVTFLFMGIGNIHTMRSSQERLAIGCSPGSFDSEKFFQKVEESRWLSHIRLVLDASSRCAELLALEQASVLVHCSDGWDRTSQLVTLAQIILDPFYRTCYGLSVLLEKDWISFGFRFKDRCIGSDEDEKSPIWLQFVDSLYQFRRQFPKHFEFNEEFLLLLAEAPYSGRFATFGFNSESERTEACKKAKGRAWEFWCEVVGKVEYKNPNFEPYIFGPLWPHTSMKRIVLWERFHLKADAGAPTTTYV